MDDLLDMLDEMSMSLPRFKSYEKTLPMNDALESALLDVYVEMTCLLGPSIFSVVIHIVCLSPQIC